MRNCGIDQSQQLLLSINQIVQDLPRNIYDLYHLIILCFILRLSLDLDINELFVSLIRIFINILVQFSILARFLSFEIQHKYLILEHFSLQIENIV